MTIGVFDSGVGGLTVLRAVHARLPQVGTAYLGDTARVPYGTRSKETVTRYALNAARLLVERESLAALVVACNTASALALDALKAKLTVPVIGVVEPTAKAAVSASKTGRIGIIGTPGTVNSGAYEREVKRLLPEAVTFARPCPLFVPLAEEGWTGQEDTIAAAVAERYLAPFRDEGIDTLILGCTHYPLLRGIIEQALPGVQLADAAEAVAAALGEELGERGAAAPLRRYYVTDVPKGFRSVAERFLGREIEELLEVDLG